MIPARNYRHARESGHPGRAGTAFAALGPRFRGATEKEEVGTICLVHTTSSNQTSCATPTKPLMLRVSWLTWTVVVHPVTDLPCKTPEGLAHNSPGVVGMSDQTQRTTT